MRFATRSVWAAFVLVNSIRLHGPAAEDASWQTAYRQPAPTAEETRDFMRRLARFVYDNHLKHVESSPQRGMIYEYFDVRRKGQVDQFVQGEALDTMHDGAWFAAAMCNAWQATGDDFYKRLLTQRQLPFYCRMLNHSDELFSAEHDDARANAHRFNREHALQPGEKGFVPYFWDDGGSVSLERRRDKNPLGPFSCVDRLARKANPQFLLDGYSLGSSNHLAQDLGVMLQLAWLTLQDSAAPDEIALRQEVAVAAANLQACRMRHHGHIPMCDAPAALAGDAGLLRHVPDPDQKAYWAPDNHYFRALYGFKPGMRYALPGFADDQEYRYCHGLAKNGGKLARPLAFKTVYDAFTAPLLYRCYCDDASPPPGINRFDLHPYFVIDGKPADYRSDRKGPSGGPRPIGSRMGPQNMVCCGWALMALRKFPGIWEQPFTDLAGAAVRVYIFDPPPGASAAEPRFSEPVESGQCSVRLRGTRHALALKVEWRGETTLRIFAAPDGQGSSAIVHVVEGQAPSVENDRGERLVFTSRPFGGAGRHAVEIELPYTVVKEQKPWANGVEHGVYSLQINKQPPRNFHLASEEPQVVAWLRHELAGGLRTWEAIFRQYGYIPSGIQAGADWESFSDAGGYAHLISAASQWLLCQRGQESEP